MKKKAFIFYGGWEGHEPELESARFKRWLEEDGYEVDRVDSFDKTFDLDYMKSMDLIIPCWTQGDIPDPAAFTISEAVEAGTGLAGCHGGMCDSFRWNVEWQFMTGSQWVSHPGDQLLHHISYLTEENLAYVAKNYPRNNDPDAFQRDQKIEFVHNSSSPIIEGMEDFMVHTEQYYLHLDPCVNVLATTAVDSQGAHRANGIVKMPVIYTKRWGEGRIFYSSLGHKDYIFDIPQIETFTRRGFLWASR